MPVDLTKINTTKQQKPKFNTSYFHHSLTGMGGKVGLFNNTNTVIADNFKKHLFQSQQALPIVDPKFNKSDKALMYASDLTPTVPGGYQDDKHHTFDLSPLSILAQTEQKCRTVRFTKLPAFLAELKMHELAKNKDDETLSVGLIANRVEYYHYRNMKDTALTAESFILHSSLVLKVTKPNAKRTTVHMLRNDNSELVTLQKSSKSNQIIVLNDIDLYVGKENGQALHPTLFMALSQIKKNYNLQDAKAKNTSYPNDLYATASAIMDYLETINMADSIREQARINHESLLDDLATLVKFMNNTPEQFNNHRKIIINAYHLIKLEELNYKENDYQRFYNEIKYQTLKHHCKNPLYRYKPYNFNKLISVNTRLSLTHQISNLKNNSAVYKFSPSVTKLQTTEKYSPEQSAIIHTTEPYSVGIAGAGSGKSHTLLGRLEFLQQNGIDFKKVLVTSFTNTAAQNIINRFKSGINSLTNANLFHKIYQANFQHELTNDLTIANLLKMISDSAPIMKSNSTINDTRLKLAKLIESSVSTGFQKVDPRKITESLIALINENLDDVITILDAVGQTSLLLEPIVINALMQNQATIKYPKELNNLDFIITDESQDTSAFEYVLLLQLAQINDAQLMIIGDANQTLYEFRNANPDFLNALERSDVFKTYTMSTNYRSKQSVLTLANQFLDVLKTNSTAKLQLHANKYSNLDLAQFKDDIELENLILQPESKKAEDFKSELIRTLVDRQDFRDWVIDQYHNKNQIAIMAYRNNDTQSIGEAVQRVIENTLGQTVTVGYTRQPTPRPNTWLSQMLSGTYDADFKKFAKSGHLTTKHVINSLTARLQVIANKRHYNAGVINQWALDQVNELTKRQIFKINLNDLNAKRISLGAFNGFISMWLIKAETKKNNVSRLINNQQNTDWQNCDIVVSTIHSAKGLEFDSVICYFDETMRSATTQENLRLFGVALTRAKSKELILNRPKLERVTNAIPVPTSFAYEKSDMFKTPMRTAYMRVKQDLTPAPKKVNP
jgi:superfamily I DNA/RNA helicase